MNLYDKRPMIAHDVWVAPNATIVGDVEICNDASVWYNVVIRGKHQHFTHSCRCPYRLCSLTIISISLS